MRLPDGPLTTYRADDGSIGIATLDGASLDEAQMPASTAKAASLTVGTRQRPQGFWLGDPIAGGSWVDTGSGAPRGAGWREGGLLFPGKATGVRFRTVQFSVARSAHDHQVAFFPRQRWRHLHCNQVVQVNPAALLPAHAAPAVRLSDFRRAEFTPATAMQVTPHTATAPVEVGWPRDGGTVGGVAGAATKRFRAIRRGQERLLALLAQDFYSTRRWSGLQRVQPLSTRRAAGLLLAIGPVGKRGAADDALTRLFGHGPVYQITTAPCVMVRTNRSTGDA